MSEKRDSNEFSGTATVVDGPPQGMARPTEDPEEKETDLWAPVTNLFGGASLDPRAGSSEDSVSEVTVLSIESPPGRAELEDADTVRGATGLTGGPGRPPETEAEETDTAPEPPGSRSERRQAHGVREPGDEESGFISGEISAGEAWLRGGTAEANRAAADGELAPGSVEVSGKLAPGSVEVSGEEGEAARRLASERRLSRDISKTVVVDRPKNLPRLSCECRLCGRKVASPRPVRFRGAAGGEIGFRCEKCHNVFCAVHVVRVSGFIESLLLYGRFRCLLCRRLEPPTPGERTS